MDALTDLEIALPTELLRTLRRQAARLEVPVEYLVAGLLLDAMDDEHAASRAPAMAC